MTEMARQLKIGIITLLLVICGCQQENKLKLNLLLDSSSFTPGDTIIFTLTVENTSPDTIFTLTPTAQLYDLLIYNSKRRAVWRWSSGKFFAQVITKRVFPPGKRKIEILFPGETHPGKYLRLGKYIAYAYITTETKLESKPVTFWIVD